LDGKFQNKLLVTFIVCFFILGSNSFSVFASQIEESTLEVQSEHVLTLLDNLPIDLDSLFELDNFTEFEKMLDEVESGTSFWPLRPYGTFFGHGHIEGLPRSDFCPHVLRAEIRAPVDGTYVHHLTQNGTVDMINGIECVIDSALFLDIGNDCWIHFGHIDLLKTIWDEIETTGNISLAKGELIGFTEAFGSVSNVDFGYYYKGIMIPPYYAFTPKLQGKVDVLYNFMYERAKLNGLYPRANLINDLFIHKDDEFWGNWEYKTGPFDSYIEEGEWVGHHDFGLYTFLNREFTTKETYWKNEYNTNYNLTDDILGLGCSIHEVTTTPGYYAVGKGHILLVEGDNTSGIIELRHQYDSSTNSDYGKFEIIANTSSILGDELQIEFFPTLLEAQSGFTANVSTYERIYHKTIDDAELPPPLPTTTPTQESTLYLYPIIFSAIIIALVSRKKKK
jgi:hypothetical protein